MNARQRHPRQRGFALLIVMLLVALLGIGAAALLDLVNIDIGIASEYRKSIQAEAASVESILETIGEQNFRRRLPQLDSPTLQTRLVVRQAGAYVLDPDGVVGTVSLTEANSAQIEAVGTNRENGFESDVRLLKIVAKEDTSFNRPVAVYEVRARSTISGGDASREARSVVYVPTGINGRVTRQRHAR